MGMEMPLAVRMLHGPPKKKKPGSKPQFQWQGLPQALPQLGLYSAISETKKSELKLNSVN